MKYFIDCEFHEYEKQPKLFGIPIGKKIPTVELISIAIVREDGETYYAESKDFSIKEAKKNNFLAEHVLPNLLNYRISNKDIKNGICNFLKNDNNPELYTWWGSYDWYVFCTLFGSMTEAMAATGFIYYNDFKDLQNLLGYSTEDVYNICPLPLGNVPHNALDDALWQKRAYFALVNDFNDKLTKESVVLAHDSLSGLIKYAISKMKKNEDGSYHLSKERVSRWIDRSKLSFDELSDEQKITPINEANKYLNVFKKFNTKLK